MTVADQPAILIVDDVPENLRLLTAMLQQAGCMVRAAISGKRALSAIKRAPPSLILLDIRMPDMDGFEVCEQLKRDITTQDIPVIFISALNETDDKIHAFAAGGVDFVTKSFHEQEVLARVKTHLELRRQKLELVDNYRRLKELEQLRDSLTHMLVHDMATPLWALDGHLQMLEMDSAKSLSRAERNNLAEARAGTKRLRQMTDEMLLVSKLEAGKLTLNLEACDLVALARKAIAPSGRVELAVAAPTMIVKLDRELIARVLQNLLGNACKFSPENGRAQLSLTLAEGQLRVAVTDAGPGIAP